MADVCVCVARAKWSGFLVEVDSGKVEFDLGYRVSGKWDPGERCYIVAWGCVRLWMTLDRAGRDKYGRLILYLSGPAMPVRTPERLRGFQGARRRWWDRCVEKLFPEWRAP